MPWRFKSSPAHRVKLGRPVRRVTFTQMAGMTEETQELIKNIEESLKATPLEPGTSISVSHAVSKAAVIYEKARNAVEFRAEHLLRRAAIERILKRRFITNSSGIGVGELLVRELLWARYLDEEKVTEEKVNEVQETVYKYIHLKNLLLGNNPGQNGGKITEWLVGIASCEIEKKLSPAPIREALINYVYQTLKGRLVIEKEGSQKNHDIQAYIGVHRAYAESDDPIIRFHLFLTYFPDWMVTEKSELKPIVSRFNSVYKEIEDYLDYPLAQNIRRAFRGEMAPFLVIRDLANEKPGEFKEIMGEPVKLEEAVRRILKKKYQQTSTKLRRAATRSIIYIFLTKMLFAFILEVPFDLIIGKTNYTAIAINTFFPPLLMFTETVSIRVPGEDNTKRVIAKIKEYCFESNSPKTGLEIKRQSEKSKLSTVFNSLYFFTFIIIFGLIIWLLNMLHFNFVSKGIFLFFVCVVFFFAHRVRLITKDYVYQEKERALTPFADFVSLPILRVGQVLSAELAQINFLIFVFDFIIEAPFKAFFEIIEDWFKFIRIKKEEITV